MALVCRIQTAPYVQIGDNHCTQHATGKRALMLTYCLKLW